MQILHIMPSWFWGTNLVFECLFLLFSIVIAVYAFRIYKFTNQRELKIFGAAFSFLAIAHLILILLNSFFLSLIGGGFRGLEIEEMLGLKNILMFIYVGFFLLGLINLTYIALKIKSTRSYILLILISALTLCCNPNTGFSVYTLSAIFFLFISLYYLNEFRKTHNKNTLLVFIGFALLFFNSSLLVISLIKEISASYVLAYLIEALGYFSITFSFINVFKDGKKKN